MQKEDADNVRKEGLVGKALAVKGGLAIDKSLSILIPYPAPSISALGLPFFGCSLLSELTDGITGLDKRS